MTLTFDQLNASPRWAGEWEEDPGLYWLAQVTRLSGTIFMGFTGKYFHWKKESSHFLQKKGIEFKGDIKWEKVMNLLIF
jgi:hypothetical protein